ncbi:MAG: hypothetical protein R2793_02600 [Flavobacteriaceae bacterium]
MLFKPKHQIKVLTFGGKEITYQAWYGIDAATLETDRTYNSLGFNLIVKGILKDSIKPCR